MSADDPARSLIYCHDCGKIAADQEDPECSCRSCVRCEGALSRGEGPTYCDRCIDNTE